MAVISSCRHASVSLRDTAMSDIPDIKRGMIIRAQLAWASVMETEKLLGCARYYCMIHYGSVHEKRKDGISTQKSGRKTKMKDKDRPELKRIVPKNTRNDKHLILVKTRLWRWLLISEVMLDRDRWLAGTSLLLTCCWYRTSCWYRIPSCWFLLRLYYFRTPKDFSFPSPKHCQVRCDSVASLRENDACMQQKWSILSLKWLRGWYLLCRDH